MWRLLVLGLLAACLSVTAAAAHNLPYSLAILKLEPRGAWQLEIACHSAALVAGLPQGHLTREARSALDSLPDEVVAQRAATMNAYLREALVIEADGRRLGTPRPRFPTVEEIRTDGAMTPETARPSAPIRLSARAPPGTRGLVFTFPPELGTVLLKVEGAGVQALSPAQASAPIAIAAPRPASILTLAQYAALGVEHIVPKGVDHILFVVCLFLLSPRWRTLALQVTAFTVAHSVTLALAVFDLVTLSSRLTETLIAVSIAVVAFDNLRSRDLKPGRPALVFAFGLLHGLGFASVLQGLGLPTGQEVLALAGFNLGIEAGQLVVLAALFVALGGSLSKPWFRTRIANPASVAIGVLALVWAAQRALA